MTVNCKKKILKSEIKAKKQGILRNSTYITTTIFRREWQAQHLKKIGLALFDFGELVHFKKHDSGA